MIQNDVKNIIKKGWHKLTDFVDVRRETIVRLEKQLYNPSLELTIRISDIFEKDIRELFEIASEI